MQECFFYNVNGKTFTYVISLSLRQTRLIQFVYVFLQIKFQFDKMSSRMSAVETLDGDDKKLSFQIIYYT